MSTSNDLARVFLGAVCLGLLIVSCASQDKPSNQKEVDACLKDVAEQFSDIKHVDLKSDSLRQNHQIVNDGIVLSFWINDGFVKISHGECKKNRYGYYATIVDQSMAKDQKTKSLEVMMAINSDFVKKCGVEICQN